MPHIVVSVALVTGGKCRFLRKAHLRGLRRCSDQLFLNGRLTRPDKLGRTTWRFRRKVSLPIGRYVVSVRGVNLNHKREFVARSSNSAGFTLR